MIAQLTSQYTRQGFTHALNIFNFPEDFPSNPVLHLSALRYLFQYGNGNPSEEKLRRRGQQLFTLYSQQHNLEYMAEAADIMNEERIFDLLRNFEEPNLDRKTVQPANMKTVYDDSQNVHNSALNKSVIRATSHLYDMYKQQYEIGNTSDEIFQHKRDCLREIECILVSKYASNESLITRSIKYIRDNVGTFGINISLQDVLLCLWSWMYEQKETDTLEQRLLQELQSAGGQCSTGYLARLINVIQGYTSDEKLSIRISEKEQYSSVIKQYLTKILKECFDEKVMDGMTEFTDEYKQYVKKSIEKVLKEWVRDYGENIINYIPAIVNTFAGCTIIK